MTTRRGLLLSLLGSFWAFLSCRARPSSSVDGSTPPSSPTSNPSQPIENQWLEDFDRSSSRTYSEEGIPVFLVGENLAPEQGRPVAPTAGRNPAHRALAASFRQGAAILARQRPSLSPNDVGKLVEVIAERDFGTLRPSSRP